MNSLRDQVRLAIEEADGDLDDLLAVLAKNKFQTRQDRVGALVLLLADRVDHSRLIGLAAVAIDRLVDWQDGVNA